MDLNKYLSSNGAPSVSELRQALVALGYDVKSNAQIRQWRKAYQGRRPSPENCAGLEQVTKGEDAGCNGYVAKPIKYKEFLKLIFDFFET